MDQGNNRAPKWKRIVYWVATLWLGLGMISTGIVQILQVPEDIAFILKLGYPVYILPFLGVLKILGVVAVLIPRYSLLKEWAYAGFFFSMTGAIYSHFAAGNPLNEALPALLLLFLTVCSWYFRPAGRKVSSRQI